MKLEEYVNAYYGGMLGLSKEYGIQKDNFETDSTAAFNVMYGAKVFSELNQESDIFKLLPKQPWTSSGWRRQASGGRSASASNLGMAEAAAFPTADHVDIETAEATMKEIVSPYTISTKAQVLGKTDDGLGDVESFLREQSALDHAYYIDEMLVAQSHQKGTLLNFESLDRVCGANAELAFTGGGSSIYVENDLDIYGLNRDSDGSNDAYVLQGDTSSNRGDVRFLTLSLVDTLIRNAIENGAKYENLIFLTGYDTLEYWKGLIMDSNTGTAGNGMWRMMTEGATPKNMSGVLSQPGMNLDTRVGYYDSIPIFASQHLPIASAANGSLLSGETGATNIYLLDMEHLHFRVAVPTTHVASEDLGVTGKLARDYAFITGGELVCTKFSTQGKIRDLKSA